ncbi:hypothetical protein J31TS4_31030 [Paenibacillus sp. J31TS4]|nr:hypothetical protein J31TS4_31030 [Paenibacillus sp. J31TS4]
MTSGTIDRSRKQSSSRWGMLEERNRRTSSRRAFVSMVTPSLSLSRQVVVASKPMIEDLGPSDTVKNWQAGEGKEETQKSPSSTRAWKGRLHTLPAAVQNEAAL